MEKLLSALREYEISATREEWNATARREFEPYFSRKDQLEANLSMFHLELRNLARIREHPNYLELLSQTLDLHRRAISDDPVGSYKALARLARNMEASDDRWLNLFETHSPVAASAPVQDRVYSEFVGIESIAEGCFLPQLRILSTVAQREASGTWSDAAERMTFGKLVSSFPAALKPKFALAFDDIVVGIAVNQWRNIAAHKSFKVVGPQKVEVSYGTQPHRKKIWLLELTQVLHWLVRAHAAVRLAQVIIYLEHVQEIMSNGYVARDVRLSSMLMQLAHDYRTVGFEVLSWATRGTTGVWTVKDLNGRPPRDALIHASQCLVEISVGILADAVTRDVLDSAEVALVQADGKMCGSASTPVVSADSYARGQISMREYMETIHWSIGATQ